MNEQPPARSEVRKRADAALEQALALRQRAETLQQRANELVATASRLRERLFEMSPPPARRHSDVV